MGRLLLLSVLLADPLTATKTSADAKSKAGRYAEAAQDWDEAIDKKVDPLSMREAKEASAELKSRAKWDEAGDATSRRSLLVSLIEGANFVEHAEPGDPRLTAQVARLRAVDPAFELVAARPITVSIDSKSLDSKAKDSLRAAVITSLQQVGLTATPGAAVSSLVLKTKWVGDGRTACGIDVSAEYSTTHKALSFHRAARVTKDEMHQCHRVATDHVAPAVGLELLRGLSHLAESP
jgi:hypothetical protein